MKKDEFVNLEMSQFGNEKNPKSYILHHKSAKY
jgi:hypothetical protein